MKRLTRRSFIGAVLSALGLSLSRVDARAADASQVLLTPELACSIAASFASSISGASNLIGVNATKFYDVDGRAVGYFVDLVDIDEQPHGYVVLDSSHESLIAEYSFDEGASSPFSAGTQAQDLQEDSRIVKAGPFAYAAPTADGAYVNQYGEDVTDELGSRPTTTAVPDSAWDDIFLGELFCDEYSLEEFYITNRGMSAFSQEQIESRTSKYACAIVALMNCAAAYIDSGWPAIYDSKFVDYFNELWNISGTRTVSTSDGITYGATTNSKIGPTFTTFCSSHGVSVVQVSKISPSFADFKSAIQRNHYGIFCCGINKQGERAGHAMAVEGCAVIKPSGVSMEKGINALLVADGWATNSTNARYLNIAFANYTDTYGVLFG